jgi:NADP-dependent 3-hydroxy acid dehydrogenase YdfG
MKIAIEPASIARAIAFTIEQPSDVAAKAVYYKTLVSVPNKLAKE